MVEPVRRRFQHKWLRERGYISAKILVGAGTIGLDMHSRSALGLVSRVTPVQTAKRNCTRDEGGPFEVGNQVLISNHRKPLSSKAPEVSVAEKPEQDSGRHD